MLPLGAEEARAQGLKIFLWDENGFPSGIGGGAFDGEELDYAYRFLKKDTRAFTGGEYCSEVIAAGISPVFWLRT